MKYLFSLIAIFLTTQIFAQVQLITNGNFSSTGSWIASPDFYYGTTYSNCPCGTPPCFGYAYLSTSGGQPGNNLAGSLEQLITLTQTYSSATLSFCWNATSTESALNSDFFTVYIFSATPYHSVTAFSTSIVGNQPGSTVTYNLTDPALLQAGLTIEFDFEASTDGGLPSTIRVDDVSLIGYPAANAPIISLSGNMNFGNVLVGNTSQQNLVITNTGNANLNINTISFPTGFSGNWNATITPGSSQNVPVTFAPISATAYSGNITVNSNASSGTNTISCSGTGTTVSSPAISLSGNMNFGNVQVGNSSTQTLTISNPGNATLNVSSIAYPTGFTGSWSGNIGAGSSQNVPVTFTPVSATTYSGNITVNSNASSGINTMACSGTGTTVSSPAISLSGNMNFGNVQVGNSSTQTLTISNLGNATLNVSSIAYPTGFTGSWSGNIGAGSSQNVSVTFTPVSATVYSGNITVNSNASSGTNTISCSGVGNISCTTPTSQASSINFSGVSSSQMTVNWTNGSGDRRVAIINTINNFTTPINGTDPNANSVYSGSGEQVVYNGVSNNVTVSGLSPNTNYWVRVYEGACSGTSSLYNSSQASNNPNNHTTSTVTPLVNSITFTNVIQNHSGIDPLHTIYSGSAYATSNPIKICADGSISTYFKVNVSSTAGIGFQLLDELNQPVTDVLKYGQLGSPIVFGNNVEVPYTHPQYMDWSSLSRPMTLQVLYNGIPISGINFPIEIYRAPVLMVHGLFANIFGGTTFDKMEFDLIHTYNYYTPSLIYKKHYPDFASFDDNKYALSDGINDLFNKALNNNYSLGAVDVVAHSMGGLLSRIYIQDEYGTHYRNDIHKLITINTPHAGSPIPDLLLSNCVSSLLFQWPIYSAVTCGSLILFPAISDMGVNSNAIDVKLNGQSTINTSRVPAYAIATQSLDPNDNGLGHIFYNIYGYLGHFHGENNDVVVSESSQQGGISATSMFSNQWHVGSSENTLVISRVKDVLNAIPNGINFDIDGYSPPNINYVPISTNPITNLRSTGLDSIYINYPLNNSTFNPGDTININVVGTPAIDKIFIAAGNETIPLYANDTALSSNAFKYIVPVNAIGEVRIIAIGSSLTDDLIDFDTLKIYVTGVSFDSISCIPDDIFIPSCGKQSLSIKGYHNGGKIKDLTFTGNVMFQIGDTNIATFLMPNVLKGIQPGSTVLSISYSSLSIQVPVIIYAGEDWLEAEISTSSNINMLCDGDSATLTANTGDYYIWNTGETNKSITVSSSGNYYVVVGNNCAMVDTSDTILVSFSPNPSITVLISGSPEFCDGDSVMLSALGVGTYSWNNGMTNQNVIIKESGSYDVTITSNDGCTSTSAPITIIVNTSPSPVISGPSSACSNSIGLYYSVSNSGNDFDWNISGGTITSGQGTNSIIVDWGASGTGTINITETDTITGCTGDTTLSVIIDSVLNPMITPNGLINVCFGDTVTLDAGSGFSSYQWSDGQTTQTIQTNTSNTYSVSVTNNSGCSGTSTTPVTINVHPEPTPKAITLNADTLFSPYGQTSDWYVVGNPTRIDSGAYHICTSDDNYYVISVDSNGCIVQSDTINADCIFTEIEDVLLTNQVQVFPNPSNGKLNVLFENNFNFVKMEVVDLFGRTICAIEFAKVTNSSKKEIDLNLASGTYYLRIYLDDYLVAKRIIIN